jgi:hypothetical protein
VPFGRFINPVTKKDWIGGESHCKRALSAASCLHMERAAVRL